MSGNFELAEKFILDASDPEFLNDGNHSAIPLNLALTGRSSYGGQPRHLKLAKILVRRGANVNLRIPNLELESASESPLELLVTYYLALLKEFRPTPNKTVATDQEGIPADHAMQYR